MARPQTKADLLKVADAQFQKLNDVLGEMSDEKKEEKFSSSVDKETASHFTRDKNTRDVLIHLYGWHLLLINAMEAQQAGKTHTFLPSPYNWRTYGDMNQEIWEKYQDTTESEAEELLNKTHMKIMKMLEDYTNDELFSKGVYEWAGNSTMGSYCVSATASHYEWAIKKLKKHVKN